MHVRHFVAVCEPARPVAELQPADFLRAFFDVVTGHYLAWTRGDVHHRDPSLANCIYAKIDGRIVGSLIDFDHAADGGTQVHSGHLGTTPFIANELPYAATVPLQVSHLYRHDLEAFYWILIWLCNCTNTAIPKTFGEWLSDCQTCLQNKMYYENHLPTHLKELIRPSHMDLWEIAHHWMLELANHVRTPVNHALRRRCVAKSFGYEAEPAVTWRWFCNMLNEESLTRTLEGRGEQDVEILAVLKEFLENAPS